ncbi:MAG: tetratricopeptide repeat protein [Sinobacteraceae bacterium]|nr:tetratricopeptide repeat protein [Nevskiaceae bacterium]
MKVLIFFLAGTVLAGCASSPMMAGTDGSLFADSLFAPPAQPVSATDVFALSPPMRDYLANRIDRYVRSEGARRGLLDALRDDFKIEYDASRTRNAAEAFASRSGNCLSLVIMAAAFAEQLAIPVTYQSVYGYDTWSRSGGFTFHSGHVNLVLGAPRSSDWVATDGNRPLIVDFLPPQAAARMTANEIPEATVVAMYLNNRAAEILADGRIDEAYWRARAAIETQPAFVGAYNTLGVIYARHGDRAQAERALRHALSREPESVEALSNLAQLLEAEGRGAEAQVLRKKLAEVEPYPPFYYFDQGMAALAQGDYRTAAELLEKESKRLPYDDEVHFALAVAELHLGNTRKARRELQLALENSTTRDHHAIYAAKLERLKSESTKVN